LIGWGDTGAFATQQMGPDPTSDPTMGSK